MAETGHCSCENVKLAILLFAFTFTVLAQQTQIGRPPAYSKVTPPAPTAKVPIKLTTGATWIDTSNRATVLTSYLNIFVPSASVPTGWIGNVNTGDAGSTSQAYQDAVLLRINWFRQMAGMASSISFSPSYNTEDQQAALMMSANGQLNHTPPSNWSYFTASGADGAVHSNLCLEIPYFPDPGCVALYIQDYGANNSEVGHRRWLLYPQTQNMGTGDVQPPFPTPFANALWVVDSHFFDTRPATRDPFIAWPPKGYVPYQLVPGRWSFSYPGADFTNTVVSMQRGGGAVALRQETQQQGYGENTVVWVPDNIDTSVSTNWPKPVVDTPITVTLTHVMVSGVDTTFTYTVTVFDPNSTLTISGHITKNGVALAGTAVVLNSQQTATSDSNGAYQFGPLPLGTYIISPSLSGTAFAPSSRSVSASTTTADFAGVTCTNSALTYNLTADPLGSSDAFNYTLASGCPWTAVSSAPWITFAAASGYGPVNLSYSYPPNRTLARTAVITVAGKTLNISQASAGQSVLGPVSPGVFLNGKWAMDTNANGVFDAGDKNFTFQIQGVGDLPVVGDWNGNGHSKTGAYNAGFWALDYNGNGQWDGTVTDRFYAFGGIPGEVPIVGDWNGDGRTKIGVYVNGFWALDYNGNGQWDGPVIDRFYGFGGRPGEIPVVGDWNGDGRTKIGSYLNGVWVLDYNGNGAWDGTLIDRYAAYTIGPGDKPVVGDWNGDGTTKIGLYRNGFWLLDTNGSGSYETTDGFYGFGGNLNEVPIVGDWNGSGQSKIGYFLSGFWVLDYNGNGRWDGTGAGGDRFVAVGGNPGEKPIPGKW